MGSSSISASDDNFLFQHEFGHYLQSQDHGLFWLFSYGTESGISALCNDLTGHDIFYTEQDANARSIWYFAKHYGDSYIKDNWKFTKNPLIGYDQTKSYKDNLSVIEGAIIPLTISIRNKDGVEDDVAQNMSVDISGIDTTNFIL